MTMKVVEGSDKKSVSRNTSSNEANKKQKMMVLSLSKSIIKEQQHPTGSINEQHGHGHGHGRGHGQQQQDEERLYQVACHCKRIGGKFALRPSSTNPTKNNDGDVKEKGSSSNYSVLAWECNCSDCSMRGNVHIVVPKTDFQIVMPTRCDTAATSTITCRSKSKACETFEDATILYEWGTKTAKRRFCKTCGILPWYIPRSNPDGIAITLNCIDWASSGNRNGDNNGDIGMLLKPKIQIKKFDGIHWETSFEASKISEESKAQEGD